MPRGISPLRSDYRPRSGRNDIVTGAGRRGTHLQIGRNDIIKSIGYVVIPGRRSGIPPQQKRKQSSTTAQILAHGGSPPVAISRKGNAARVPAPAYLPAVAHRRAGANRVANEGNRIPIINVTSFSPHPSCLRDASAIHLPPRGKA